MIEFKNVSKFYKNNFGITNISFKIEQNSIVLFIGENGSGKSTCLKLIAKSIFLNKKDQGIIVNDFIKISYLPEKFVLPSLLKAKDYIKNIVKLYGVKEDINTLLEKYQVPNKLICNLSKGMLQKLGIIMTIVVPSELYLFDEPTDGLDELSRKLFKDDIIKLINNGKTVIISTHNKNYFKDMSAKTLKFAGGILCK